MHCTRYEDRQHGRPRLLTNELVSWGRRILNVASIVLSVHLCVRRRGAVAIDLEPSFAFLGLCPGPRNDLLNFTAWASEPFQPVDLAFVRRRHRADLVREGLGDVLRSGGPGGAACSTTRRMLKMAVGYRKSSASKHNR